MLPGQDLGDGAADGATDGPDGRGGPPGGVTRHRRRRRSTGLRVVGRRLLVAIPVLWGVTFLTFAVMNLLPGDAARALLGPNATQAEVNALAARLHLNEPFFERYGHWLGGVLSGNLGTSLTSGQSVAFILGEKLPVTVELVVYALIISLVFAVPTAILAARKPGGWADRLSMVASISGLSVAPFVLGLVLIIVFAVKLAWFPAIGFTSLSQSLPGNLRTLTLPAASIGLPLFGAYTRLLRADIVDQLHGEDYVLTAKAKGASSWQVLTRHVLRNSVFGLITLVGLNLGPLIGGTVIVEEIFSLPGVGQELLTAINDRDVVLVEGIVLVFATVVVVANLLTDLTYSVLDPRVRHGRPAA